MVRAVVLCAGVALVAAATTPVIFGQLAKGGYEDFLTGFQNGAGDELELETISYERGYLESTAVSRLTIRGRFEAAFLLEHRITHGPVALDGQPLLMRMASEMWPEDPSERDALEEPLLYVDVEAPLLETGVRLEAHGPEYRSLDGSVVWGGLVGWLEVDRSTRAGRSEVEIGAMTFERGQRMRFDPITASVSFDLNDVEHPLRSFSIRMERIAMARPGQTQMDWLGPIELADTYRPDGNLVGHDIRFVLEAGELGGEAYGPVALELEARNLDAEGLSALRDIRDQQDATSGSGLGSVQRVLLDMAPHSPTLVIRRLEFHGPDGELRMSGRFEIDGQDYAAQGVGAGLAQALLVSAEIHVSEPLAVRALEGATAMTPLPNLPAQAVVGAFLDSGYLVREDGLLHVRLESKGSSSLRLNDRPFSPHVLVAAFHGEMGPRAPAPNPHASSAEPELAPPAPAPDLGSMVPASPRPASRGNRELDEMRRQMGLSGQR